MVDIKWITNQLMNKQKDKWKQDSPTKLKLRINRLFTETINIENYVKYN